MVNASVTICYRMAIGRKNVPFGKRHIEKANEGEQRANNTREAVLCSDNEQGRTRGERLKYPPGGYPNAIAYISYKMLHPCGHLSAAITGRNVKHNSLALSDSFKNKSRVESKCSCFPSMKIRFASNVQFAGREESALD